MEILLFLLIAAFPELVIFGLLALGIVYVGAIIITILVEIFK